MHHVFVESTYNTGYYVTGMDAAYLASQGHEFYRNKRHLKLCNKRRQEQ